MRWGTPWSDSRSTVHGLYGRRGRFNEIGVIARVASERQRGVQHCLLSSDPQAWLTDRVNPQDCPQTDMSNPHTL